VLSKSGEESGITAAVGAQETGQGSRYCGTIDNSLVYQIDAFSAAYHFLRQVVFRSKVLAINQKAMGPDHENRKKLVRSRQFGLLVHFA